MGETAEANVSVIPQPSLTGDITVDYEVKGEVYGGTPHDVFGSFKLRNLGPVTPWLDIDKTEGTLEGGSSDSLVLTVNTTGMADGKYQAWILLQDNFDHEMIVPVELVVDNFMIDKDLIDMNTGRLFLASPNPFTETTSIFIKIPGQEKAKLEIISLQGIVILSVEVEMGLTNSTQFEWDGTDHAGRKLPAGIYLLKVRAGDLTDYGRLVLVN